MPTKHTHTHTHGHQLAHQKMNEHNDMEHNPTQTNYQNKRDFCGIQATSQCDVMMTSLMAKLYWQLLYLHNAYNHVAWRIWSYCSISTRLTTILHGELGLTKYNSPNTVFTTCIVC
eukprot:TRINITY_DN167397_c0_g1_i1.p1 TRINITY_DN167397_c0_g1~~TRINITY_DN167397_c0_g1_i1.p1  ORF type:complete len:116 (-),score=15.11 TRINITY_DN167397_c0_g1_i1:123-470(-)